MSGSGSEKHDRLRSALHGAAAALWRVRFTLLMLLSLRLAAWLTGTHLEALSAAMLQRVGFAPKDLWQMESWRAVSSALVTDGGASYRLAVLAMAAFVGAAEWQRGTTRAAATFWGVHFATILVESFAVALPLHLSGDALGTALAAARDVGPSAGYFSCLGLAIVSLPVERRVRFAWVAAVFAALLATLAIPVSQVAGEVRELSAGIAHLIALPLGVASSWIARGARSAGP